MEQNIRNNENSKTPTETLSQNEAGQSPLEQKAINVPPEPPQQSKKQNINYPDLPRIRTYEGDIAATIKNQNESKASITAKQSVKIQKMQQKDRKHSSLTRIKRSNRRMTIVILSILILVVFVLLVIVLLAEDRNRPTPTVYVPSEIIFADHIEHISPSVLSRNSQALLQEEIAQIDSPSNTVIELFIGDENTETRAGHISTKEMFDLLSINPPGQLVRALDTDFVFGTHVLTHNQPFLIFKVTSYENAFAGMLEWESTMPSDLVFITESSRFISETEEASPEVIDSEVSTSSNREEIVLEENETENAASDLVSPTLFKDQVVKNHDVRYAIWPDGSTKILYAFPNQNTLVITTRESTLIEILDRLNQARFAR